LADLGDIDIMPKINSVWLRPHGGAEKNIVLTPDTDDYSSALTVITGRNGTGKSTLLKTIVSALISDEHVDSVEFANPVKDSHETRVLCFSGSMADRFPTKTSAGRPTPFDRPNYLYFGQLVGANLLSRRGPIETILPIMLEESNRSRFEHSMFSGTLREIGLLPNLVVKAEITSRIRRNPEDNQFFLRELEALANGVTRGKQNKSDLRISGESAAYILSTTAYDDILSFNDFARGRTRRATVELNESGPLPIGSEQMLSAGALRFGLMTEYLRVSDIVVRRPAYADRSSTTPTGSIFDLSSGEFHFLTLALGLLFSIEDDSVILVDEPEGGLHPQWQVALMSSLTSLVRHYQKCHLIVGTHSPLIVSNAPEGSAIVDMDGLEATSPSEVPYGRSSEQILFDQFGLASSRNKSVIDAVQRAVSLIERGDYASGELDESKKGLLAIRERLADDDPLIEVIDALMSIDGI
jgi:predicted ATPase